MHENWARSAWADANKTVVRPFQNQLMEGKLKIDIGLVQLLDSRAMMVIG